jgi:hypothetical protein
MNEHQVVGEAVAGQSASLRKRMQTLAANLKLHTFDLAEALVEAQDSHCYLEWGFESQVDYAWRELGIKPRRAQYLSKIVRVCRECGVARKDYEPIGDTKLREITRLDPKSTFFNTETKIHEPMVDHIVRVIAEAPENSLQEITEEVARLMGMDGMNAMLTRSYRVTRGAYTYTFKRFFEAMRMKLGSKGRDGTGAAIDYSDGACLEFGLIDWLNDPSNFLEETDCSHDQIEVPMEETNVRTDGEAAGLDTTETTQDTFLGPSSITI